MDSNTNNSARSKGSKSSLVNGLLFTDSKPLTPTLGKKTTNGASNYISNKLILIWLIKGDDTKLEELIKPLENRLKTLQTTVKELQADTTLIVETLTVIKGQVSKAVAETILPLEDWVSILIFFAGNWNSLKVLGKATLCTKRSLADKKRLF